MTDELIETLQYFIVYDVFEGQQELTSVDSAILVSGELFPHVSSEMVTPSQGLVYLYQHYGNDLKEDK